MKKTIVGVVAGVIAGLMTGAAIGVVIGKKFKCFKMKCCDAFGENCCGECCNECDMCDWEDEEEFEEEFEEELEEEFEGFDGDMYIDDGSGMEFLENEIVR